MNDPTTLLALAERCEQAAGPDRELDVAIARALDWKPLYCDDYSQWWPPAAVADARKRKRSILHHPTQPLPMVTASLDAAVTLVPEGWAWCVHDVGIASVMRASVVLKATSATPALAFCAAALRARAAMVQPSSDT